MTEEAYRELRALLFGQSPYERESAPEPELLIDLAPALDASLLPYAYRTIQNIAFMNGPDRLRGLVRLLERTGVEDHEWLSYFGKSLWQYPDLAYAVPEDVAVSAVRAIKTLGWHDERSVMALLALTKREACREQAIQALRKEFHYLTRAVQAVSGKGAALFLLIAEQDVPLTTDMVDLLLSSVEGLRDSVLKARLYTGILGHLEGEKKDIVRNQAMEAVRNILPDRPRAMLLLTLCDQLAGPQRKEILNEAWKVARGMERDDPARMGVFAELSLRVPPGDRAQVLKIAEAGQERKIAGSSAEEALAEAYASISEHVPESLHDLLREQVGRVKVPEHALGDLAPFLSEEQLRRALELAIQAVDTPFGPEGHLLSKIAPHLSEELLSTGVGIAAAVPSHREDLQAKVVLSLAPFMTARVALEAVALANNMESLWWKGRTLGALLPRLPHLYQRELIPLIETVGPDRMCALLGELAYGDHVDLLTHTMDTIWAHYGGGPLPPETEYESAELADEVPLEKLVEQAAPQISRTEMESTVSGPGKEATATAGSASRGLKEAARHQEAIVHTGFAMRADPASPIPLHMPLERGTDYFFWLEVENSGPQGMEETPTPDENCPSGEERLHVVLYPFLEGISVRENDVLGELRVLQNGSIVVTRQPAALPGSLKESPLATRRIFFPVQTPNRAGTYPLRCGIYRHGMLIQSRTIRVRVMATPKEVKGAVRSMQDYNLAHSVRAQSLPDAPYRLSIMLDDNGKGTISFRFFGEGGLVQSTHVDARELQEMTREIRGELRKTAWGDGEEWKKGKPYCYEGPRDPDRLRRDLFRLAAGGRRLYDHIKQSSTEKRDRDPWKHLMRSPGLVQVAWKTSEGALMPAALLYDHPLNTAMSDHEICDVFSKCLEGQESLEESPCFQGNCPNYGQDHVVCPSGFWGFRHSLGMPLSVGKSGLSALEGIAHGEAPKIMMGAFRGLELLETHESRLRKIAEESGWNLEKADRRAEVVSMMREGKPDLVYFYAHGGVQGTLPCIRVGNPREKGITRDNIRNSRIRWRENRPLVFINSCHTTALESEKLLNLAGTFVRTAQASGVIGAEITLLEPLASQFAEEFMARFLRGEPLGNALRGARLSLLGKGNPLGLVYIPFSLADLRLVRGKGGE